VWFPDIVGACAIVPNQVSTHTVRSGTADAVRIHRRWGASCADLRFVRLPVQSFGRVAEASLIFKGSS